ncbi:MAG: hypothetical protein FWB91_10100 [Defluviitaleaceae bacterium]|nr:hypothetical protein [Defluviitaleaceae bacterium]
MKIRDAALKLGYIDALTVTGHPFDIWLSRIKGTHLERLANMHDPAKVSGWSLEEITIWVGISPVPPVEDWPEDCGEMAAHYVSIQGNRNRRSAWIEAISAMGYEVQADAMLPARAAAIRAGLGVHGLFGPMIAPDYGSFIDIAALLVRAAPPQDARGPEFDLSPGCGNCGICIEACPTGAISENGVNTLRCLRHYMGNLGTLPEEDYPKMGRRVYGCETCQRSCPKNAKLKRTPPSGDLIDSMKLEKLLTSPTVSDVAKYVNLEASGVKALAALAAANTGRKDLRPLVEALTDSEDEVLGKMARWAAKVLKK